MKNSIFVLLVNCILIFCSKYILAQTNEALIINKNDINIKIWTEPLEKNKQQICELKITIKNKSNQNTYFPIEGECVKFDSSGFFYDNSLYISDLNSSQKYYGSLNTIALTKCLEYPIDMKKLAIGDSLNIKVQIENNHKNINVYFNLNYNTNKIEPYLKEKNNKIFETTNVKFWTVGFRNISIQRELVNKCQK